MLWRSVLRSIRGSLGRYLAILAIIALGVGFFAGLRVTEPSILKTADAYIEKATYEIGKKHRVKVATSDGPEQLIILGHGALRVSASNFREEMEQVQGQISAVLEKNNQKPKNRALRAAMEKAQSPEKE